MLIPSVFFTMIVWIALMRSATISVSSVRISMYLLFRQSFALAFVFFISHYHQFFSILTFQTTWQIEQLMRGFLAEKTKHRMLRKALLVLLRLKMTLKIAQIKAKLHQLLWLSRTLWSLQSLKLMKNPIRKKVWLQVKKTKIKWRKKRKGVSSTAGKWQPIPKFFLKKDFINI